MKFNETQTSQRERAQTTNKAGGEAYDATTPEFDLYINTINNLLEDKYYEDDEDSFERLYDKFEAVAEKDPEFALKLAYYAREEMFLRQVPQALLVFASNHEAYKDTGLVRKYATGIMQRADEPLDVLALHVQRNGRSIPNALEKGIEDALHQFDEYQFAKYDRRRRDWRYRDLMALVHPNPRDDEREEIFEKIVHGDLSEYDVEPLKQHGTWEDKASDAGQDDDMTKEEAYRERLDRMPLKATIMQTRDMLDAGLDPEEFLTDELLDQVSDGKLWPFKYYTAYNAVRNAGYRDSHIDQWFESAIDQAVYTLPDALEETYVSVDVSGSMTTSLSDKSNTTYKDISALFGAICAKMGARTSAFATGFREFDIHFNTPVLEGVKKFDTVSIGHGTNATQVIDNLTRTDQEYETVVIFTDMQLWQGSGIPEAWDRYKSQVSPDANLYIVDLSSYGDLLMPDSRNDVFQVSGWGESIIEHISQDKTGSALQDVRDIGSP